MDNHTRKNHLGHGYTLHSASAQDAPLIDPQFLRDHSDTEYHPCGTCKMGPASDPLAVVDAAIMIGEKAVDLIKASVAT